MSNSLLEPLPALHGTMLSIIVGFVTAFAFYAYQATSSARQNLDDIKREVQILSKPSFECSFDKAKYLNDDGELDWQKFKDGLRNAASLFSHLDYEERGLKRTTIIIDDMKDTSVEYSRSDYYKKHGMQIDAVYIEKSNIEKAAMETLGLLSLAMTSYPYLGQGMLNRPVTTDIDNDKLWLDDLSRYNSFLLFLRNGSNRSLNELMNQYRLLDIDRQKMLHETSMQKMIETSQKQGITIPEEEIQRIKKQFHTIRETNYRMILNDFFLKISHINQNLAPKAKESLIKLTTYENKFKLKTRTIWVLAWIIHETHSVTCC